MQKLVRWLFPLVLAATAYGNVWDADADFSNTSNPNGVWSYLYAFPSGSSALFTQAVTNSATGWPGWSTNLPIPNSIYMYANNSGQNYYADNRFIPKDSMFMDPEGGTISVVFSAPQAGQYTIQGFFVAADTALSQHPYPVEVLDNSAVIWNSTLSNFDDGGVFDLTENLAVGDTIAFSVLTGSTGCSFCFLSTGFSGIVSVDQTPPPTPSIPSLPPYEGNGPPPSATPEPNVKIPLSAGMAVLAIFYGFLKGRRHQTLKRPVATVPLTEGAQAERNSRSRSSMEEACSRQ